MAKKKSRRELIKEEKQDMKRHKLEGTISIVAAILVLLVAMINPLTSSVIAVALLAIFAILKFFMK